MKQADLRGHIGKDFEVTELYVVVAVFMSAVQAINLSVYLYLFQSFSLIPLSHIFTVHFLALVLCIITYHILFFFLQCFTDVFIFTRKMKGEFKSSCEFLINSVSVR